MKRVLLSLSISLFLFLGLNAQSTANYAFTTSAGASLTDMTNAVTPALITGSGTGTTNQKSAVTNIGFTFYYMGTAYTQFSVNSNGQMRLGGTQIGTTAQSPALNVPLLVPFNGPNGLPRW